MSATVVVPDSTNCRAPASHEAANSLKPQVFFAARMALIQSGKLFGGASAGADGSAGYMFAFEVTSILIIIAMVGAVVIARKRED